MQISIQKKSPKLTIQNYQAYLRTWKQPHLQQIKQTCQDFHSKVVEAHQQFRKFGENQPQLLNKVIDKLSSQQIHQDKFDDCKMTRACKKKTDTLLAKNKADISNSISQQKVVVDEPLFQIGISQQWKPDVVSSFRDYDDVIKNYHDIFQNKQKLKKKGHNSKLQDFRVDQWEMVNQIYKDLHQENSPNVCFDAIIGFFENCQLFYYFYNIHPHRLPNLIQESAKKYQGKLTKEQFCNIFLIDRPTLSEYQFKTQRGSQSVCILADQRWKDIRAVFDTLDTFGNQEISIKNFFQKINCTSNFGLLQSEALYFPEVDRTYSLQKIFFDLQNKFNFPEKVCWQQIEDKIRNFDHIQQPTLEKIYQSKISRAQISKDLNYFMLEPRILKIIKNIFFQCPKYCNSFVKTSLFALQLLESSTIKKYFNHATRLDNFSKKEYLTLEKIIKLLSNEAPLYFDADQMLEHFSIKGPKKITQINIDDLDDQSSEQDIKQQRVQRKLKKIKSLESFKKLNKNNNKKTKNKLFQTTKPQQFNLFKRQIPTIRQIKLKQMIQQRQMIDEIQLNKKFKANSIPVALNPERYQKYAKSMQKKKISILNRLNLKREADSIVIQYLKANTKLFEVKSKKAHCHVQHKYQARFQPKPVPIHNSEELLEKIEQEKAERRKKLFEQAKKKYQEKYWKNLKVHDGYIEDSKDSLLEQIELIKQECAPIRRNHDVPDFKHLHQKFSRQLQSRKQKIQPTVIQQFRLTSPKQPKYQSQLNTIKQKTIKQKSPKNKYNHISPSRSPPPAIKLTKKFQDWISFNQAREAQKQIQSLQKQKQKQERLIKQRNFAKFMQKNLGNCTDNTAALRLRTQQKLYNFQQYMQQLQHNTQNQLAQMYSRVLRRPFLFEGASDIPAIVNHRNHLKNKQTNNDGHIRRDLPRAVDICTSHQQNLHEQERGNEGAGGYEYRAGIFDKQSEQFHPIQSENLNQSF